MAERRLEGRLLCADMVEVEWTDRSGWLWITTALLEDISGNGACLHTEKAMSPGTEVILRIRGAEAPARISYCTLQELGYFLGVEFRNGFHWSKQEFLPQHLLDLSKLAARGK